ncbi:MAG: cyclase family protein [Wenzhouxiangella sp.]|nr:cyclase family protein [Wenzhouxiangella sp.]MCH8478224.1 cyclase family protein [Wenzhouxiangella sp.]
MIATIEFDGSSRQADLGRGTCLAIPLRDQGRHPHFFVDESARFTPLAAGSFSGRVKQGCSCNVDRVQFVPHCHGTHTEGVGHVLGDTRPVQQALSFELIPAALVSVTPTADTQDTPAGIGPVIEESMLELPPGIRALVIRSLPNTTDKCTRRYDQAPPYPLLSVEAMDAIVEAGVEHLLIDTPSVDAADDGGHLAQHRRFWGFVGALPSATRTACTITEMIYVPDHLPDGLYLLSLGVSAIEGDASPSAPVLYPLS